jgi:hypothetical protein
MIATQPGCDKLAFSFLGLMLIIAMPALALGANVRVSGEVKTSLNLSADGLHKMPSFHINNVALLEEKKAGTDQEKLIAVASYKGVLLRDILEQAGMKFVRKFEPGAFIRVRGADKKEVVLSFGEVFYSSIGRSILLAYERDGKPLNTLEMVISTDIRSGRRIMDVREILVERVPVQMKAYEDRKQGVVRPPQLHHNLRGQGHKQDGKDHFGRA